MLPARRAARDLHAASLPDLPEHKAIFFAYEYAGAVRNIYLKDPGPAPVDSWMGQSVGKWEGDTLVIDVTGFNDQTWFDRAGNFHSEQLHVVERYTRTGAGRHQLRGDDRGSEASSRGRGRSACRSIAALEKNAQLMDFKCVEFVEELMYGQFAEEAADP